MLPDPNNLSLRIDSLEQRIVSLEAALLVKKELGGELIEREKVQSQDVEEVVEQDPLPLPTNVTSNRAACSQRATSTSAYPLSRNFRPSVFGYTTNDFERDYPDVNPALVLESFFSHHLGKGDTSKNWLEKFWSYAARAQQIEKERKMSNPVETDSMGLPVDRKARREMLGQ